MDVHLLRIMMATNIPNSTPVEFTRSMLYHPEYTQLKGSGTYPYITDEVEYSTTNIGALTYPEIVDTFFNRDKFINMVSNARGKLDNKVKLDKQKTLEHNVMTMMLLLFPTKYFTVNNHKQSIELLEPGISTHYNRSIFYNPLKTMSSYVKINSKPYTVTEMIWLNDILNHPTYRKLLEEVYNLNRSLNTYTTEMLGKITKVKANVLREIDAIETEITNGIKIGSQGRTAVTNQPYASENNYNALFAILFLKKIINNEVANEELIKNINDEIKNAANNNYAGKDSTRTPKPDNYVPPILNALQAGLEPLDRKPTDEYTRLKTILDKMFDANIKPILSTTIGAGHVKDTISLTSHVESLFNRNLIKDGADLIEQYLSAKNINLSKQSNSRNENQIVSQFKYNVQYKYIRPTLTTTNIELQNYIDAITPDIANEWIKQFEKIYNKYVLKMKDVTIDSHLLNLNVNNINMEKSGTSVPTKEIYIKLTLVDGEVNDSNKSDIYCPITNDALGNELLHLIEHRTDNANILKEDVSMFAVNSKQSANSFNNQPQRTPITNKSDNKYAPVNAGPNVNTNYVVAKDTSDKFGPIIIKSADQKKLGEIVDEIRKRTKPGIQMTPESILEYINTTYADSLKLNKDDQYTALPDLPSAINEWSKTSTRSNATLQDKLTAMKSALDTSYKIINGKVTDSKPNGNPADRIKLSSQLAIIGLYAYIVELLLANETNKKIVAISKGGKVHKKRRHKTIKCKSKPRYKTHKRRNF
jgi:hypothetical protein